MSWRKSLVLWDMAAAESVLAEVCCRNVASDSAFARKLLSQGERLFSGSGQGVFLHMVKADL